VDSEARYRRIAERYALATSAARVGVWDYDVDSADLYLDSNIKALLGYEESEIDNQLEYCVALIHPDDQPVAIKAAKVISQSGRDEYSLEFRMLHKTDGVRWVSVSGSTVRDGSGRLTRYVGTLTDITRRKLLELNIQEAISAEHARIGRNLHDGLGQELAGISFLLKSLENQLARQSSPICSEVAQIRAALSDAVSHTRDLARDLYPVTGTTIDIISVLRKLAEGMSRLYGVECQVDNRCRPAPTLGRTPSNQLYFIAQEAVNNAIRHSDASKVSIQCEVENLHFTMTVTDNGKPKPSAESDRGLGLRIMDYRASSIGGALEVQASPSGGFTVSCRLPLQSSYMEQDV